MAVNVIEKKHITEIQHEAEQAMLAEFESGHYTLQEPLVKYNLYSICPLSAVVCFETEEEVAITVTVLGKKQPQGNLYHTFAPAKKHILPIVGLYNDYVNKVEIKAYRGESKIIEIAVPQVFTDYPDPILSMDTTAEYLQDNLIIISPAGVDMAVGYDYAGDARFYINIPCVFDLKRLKNGNIVIGTDRLLRLPYYMSGIYEMSMTGKIYNEFRLPGGYHHDSFEMPDGDLLILTEDLTSETVEDMCVLVDRKTGEIKKTWDYKDFMPVGYGRSGSWSEEDWFHNNAVWYDANTNSLTFSGRHCSSIVNIDFEFGPDGKSKLNWVITDPQVIVDPEDPDREHCGWPQDFVDKYCFKPVKKNGQNFGWQYEQHACLITPNGDVMCFDNHHWGCRDPKEYMAACDNYSRGVRWAINTDDMTIEQVWEYGKDRGAEFFSPYICNVEYYNEGHYMVHSGGIAYDAEGAPSELLGPAAAHQGGKTRSTTVEIDNDKKMLELKVVGNFYRGEKLKPFECCNLIMGKGQALGAMGVTKENDVEIPFEYSGEELPAGYEAWIEEEIDRFTLHATFRKGQLVILSLRQGEEEHQYFINTNRNANDFKAMCVGTFLDASILDENAMKRPTDTAVNKAGLSGTYDVRVFIEDTFYETGVKITC